MTTEPASPPQKKRGAPEEEKLSLEAIREAVRSGVGGSTATLKQNLDTHGPCRDGGHSPAGEDPRTPCCHQQPAGGATAHGGSHPRVTVLKKNARLQALENKVQTLQTTGTASTTDTDAGGCKPAWMGG